MSIFFAAGIRAIVGVKSGNALDRRMVASSLPSCIRVREKFMKRGTMMMVWYGALFHGFFGMFREVLVEVLA